MRRSILLIFVVVLQCSVAVSQELNHVKLAPGFKISLYADQSLANDIQAMTLDRHGRVVVTGPGYVKILHHDFKAGRASHATTFATPKTGGMGLWFEGDDLLITAESWLSRYRDQNGDGVADGAPERILPFVTGEHGGHAIRKGPDGWIYVIAGNDAGIDERHIRGIDSAVFEPEAGGIVRISPDLKKSEVIAHGFRNPYDFDFNAFGDIFTYDSDCERDEFLPWSTPTRVFHVEEGGHHGWRLKGYLRSFARQPRLFDVIPSLVDVGRGSPTGVTCYRHDAFPEAYRGGLFILDWTFGRVHFLPLKPNGESYNSRLETFIEPIGGDGFAPTDIVVAPDGALFVSIGGRKTRGTVYRITHERMKESKSNQADDLDRVLKAAQPLDAWSRQVWEPIARRLGATPFADAIQNANRSDFDRMRAVEVLLELFGGPSVNDVERAWNDASDALRSRMAWALSKRQNVFERPAKLVNDRKSLRVQIELTQLVNQGRLDSAVAGLELLKYQSSRVIPAAESMLRGIPRAQRKAVINAMPTDHHIGNLNRALSIYRVDPSEENRVEAISVAIRTIKNGPADEKCQLNAVRLMIVALGDWDLDHSEADVFCPYTPAVKLVGQEQLVRELQGVVRPLLQASDAGLQRETFRLLSMLGDSSPMSRQLVMASITSSSSPTHDLHALIVADRLTSPLQPGDPAMIAGTLCRLDQKLDGKAARIKQTWNLRVGELFESLSKKHPKVVTELVKRTDFVTKGHIEWATRVDVKMRAIVASSFFEATRKVPEAFPLDEVLLSLFDDLPADVLLSEIRRRPQEINAGTVKRLAKSPIDSDRVTLVKALMLADPLAVDFALQGLMKLEPSRNAKDVVAALKVLRRSMTGTTSRGLRESLAAWATRELGLPKLGDEPKDSSKIASHYAALFEAFTKSNLELARELITATKIDPKRVQVLLGKLETVPGSKEKGADLFKTLQCASCHFGAALGPDLTGVGKRLSREDLFAAILEPAKDVAPGYRPLLIETKDGKTYAGFLTFESAEGILLQTGPTAVIRLRASEIENRRPSDGSLMPDGLLQEAKDQDVVDLYAFLKSL